MNSLQNIYRAITVLMLLYTFTSVSMADDSNNLITRRIDLNENILTKSELKKFTSFYYNTFPGCNTLCVLGDGDNDDNQLLIKIEDVRVTFIKNNRALLQYTVTNGWNILEITKRDGLLEINSNELDDRYRILLPINIEYNKLSCTGNNSLANLVTSENYIKNRPRTVIPSQNQKIIYDQE